MTVEQQAAAKALRDAAKLLIELGWTQKAFARDAKGKPVPSIDEDAVCFCLFGAINRASPAGAVTWVAVDAVERLLPLGPGVLDEEVTSDWLTAWNDEPERTKEEVIAALEGVADELEGKKG